MISGALRENNGSRIMRRVNSGRRHMHMSHVKRMRRMKREKRHMRMSEGKQAWWEIRIGEKRICEREGCVWYV